MFQAIDENVKKKEIFEQLFVTDSVVCSNLKSRPFSFEIFRLKVFLQTCFLQTLPT